MWNNGQSKNGLRENDNEINTKHELNCLLLPSGLENSKNLSSSAPGAISNQECKKMLSNMNLEEPNDIADIEVEYLATVTLF